MNVFPIKPKLPPDELELIDMYYDFNYYREKRALKDMTDFIERKEALYAAKKALDSYSQHED